MDVFFLDTVSYNRFVEIQKTVIQPLAVYLKLFGLGKCSGISFVDFTALKVCHYKIKKQHKVFKGIATVGKSTMRWFYGFKLHLIINEKGEILSFTITQANVDDREPLKNEEFLKGIL